MQERAAGTTSSNQVVLLPPNATGDLGSPTDSHFTSDSESEVGDHDLVDLSEQDVKPS